MKLDEAKSKALDDVLKAYAIKLRDTGDDTAAVTLAYTHNLHMSWRTVLRMLPLAPEWAVLDVGCGLGILDFEVAANQPSQIVAVDIEPGFVEHAETLRQRMADLGLFSVGSSLHFEEGDIHALAFADETFDFVFVRELLQFLPDPLQALRQLFRVLRPGAYLCISDMDDQLRITWPPASEAFQRVVAAVAQVQHERGGDRHVGRKLTTYLRNAGFEIASVVVLPEAQHRVVDPSDNERALIIEQLHAARGRVVSAGAIDADHFDADLATLEAEEPFEEFRMNARIIVLARRPDKTNP